MVAKSFIGWEQIGEIFEESGRKYINVKNPKTGKERKVRWYTLKEFLAMYPEEKGKINEPKEEKPNVKLPLGFINNYITIFSGDNPANEEWFESSQARFAMPWGWYFPSDVPVPADVPAPPVRLDWDKIGNEDGTLKDMRVVERYCNMLRFGDSPSEYQGAVGDRIERVVTITNAVSFGGNFGTTTLHLMKDEDENVYVWSTGSKCWAIGLQKHIRGTVKELKEYNGVKETVLTRCTEVK